MQYRLIAIFALAALASAAHARFLRPEIEKVPVDRLVNNLEKLVDQQPKNVQARFNLARLHAMAYALKIDTCETNKKQANAGAWFGYTPSAVPFKSVTVKDKEKLDHAKMHLRKAITTYGDVLKLQADHLPSQLGLAWCVEQSGDKIAAIQAYRKTIDAGWNMEGN